MTDVAEIELVLPQEDSALPDAVLAELAGKADARILPPSRAVDVTTVLVTATAAANLLSALLGLRTKLTGRVANVTVRNEAGDSLGLLTASTETLGAFVGLAGPEN
jgi:hypothetical protein